VLLAIGEVAVVEGMDQGVRGTMPWYNLDVWAEKSHRNRTLSLTRRLEE
jgi:hypothetical protein